MHPHFESHWKVLAEGAGGSSVHPNPLSSSTAPAAQTWPGHSWFNINRDDLPWGAWFGLSRWLSGKESSCQWRRCGFDPWVGKIPWRRKWLPTPVFLPGESRGLRSLAQKRGSQKSETRLSCWAGTHAHTQGFMQQKEVTLDSSNRSCLKQEIRV